MNSYTPNYKPNILIVDGNYFLRRAMYTPSTRELSNDTGMPTGAIYSFFNSLRSSVNSIQCNALVVVWDGGHSERRETIYPEYKDRHIDPDAPEELDVFGMTDNHYFNHQKSWTEKLLDCYGIPQVTVPSKEGDDVIYQLTRLIKGNKVLISEDADYFTLIREDVSVYRPIKKQFIDLGSFEAVTGYYTPRHFLYAKCMLGDGSDNIPSIAKGVGDKTVRDILSKIENENDVTTSRIIKEASSFNKARYDKVVTAGDAINRNLDLIDISKESFDIFQLKSIIDTLELRRYPNLQMLHKLYSVLNFGQETISGLNNSLIQLSEFQLSPLVNKDYLKEVAMNETGILGGI